MFHHHFSNGFPYYLVINFPNSDLLPTVMQNIGLALLTILIPLVLFIFSMQEESLFEWDKIVILDKVVEAKKLLTSVALIFLPLLFWNTGGQPGNVLLFLLFIGGVSFLVKILINAYRWIKTVEIKGEHDSSSFRNALRNKYLAEVTNLVEKGKVWSLTWRKEISNNFDERNLVKKFILNIDALISNEEFNILSVYLRTFNEFINKRSLYDWIIFGDLFKKLLEWHFTLYQKDQEQRTEETPREIALYESRASLEHLIEALVLSSLQKGTAYLFFDELKKHTADKSKEYLDDLFLRSICSVYFDSIGDSDEKYDIWEHHFPPEWKVTKETLADPSNHVSKAWLNSFFQWLHGRDFKQDFDKNLDQIASNLFPTTEPTLWAKILTLVSKPWVNNDRMKSLVEQWLNFGFMGRMMISDFVSPEQSDKEHRDQLKAQEEATVELALLLFKNHLSIPSVKGFITDLEKLEYEDGKVEEARRKDLINTFNQILVRLEAKSDEKP